MAGRTDGQGPGDRLKVVYQHIAARPADADEGCRNPQCLYQGTAELNEIMNGTNIAIGHMGCCIGDGRHYPYSTHIQRVCLEYGYKQPRSRLEYGYSMRGRSVDRG